MNLGAVLRDERAGRQGRADQEAGVGASNFLITMAEGAPHTPQHFIQGPQGTPGSKYASDSFEIRGTDLG